MDEQHDLLTTLTDADDAVKEAAEPHSGTVTLLARMMLNAALQRQPDLLAAARRPGAVVMIHVPDAEWGPEIAVSWPLLFDPLCLNTPSQRAAEHFWGMFIKQLQQQIL